MADFGAHLNRAAQSSARPSVFDLLAQESLLSTLRPAFAFCVRNIVNLYPGRFSALDCYKDEMFYCLLALIEKHYIWTKNASLSEHFYGLKRITLSKAKHLSDNITVKQKLGSLACLVILPYLKLKLKQLFSQLKEEKALNDPLSSRAKRNWKDGFFKLFPYIHCLMEGSAIATTICYIIKLTDFHSVSNGFLGITLTYGNFDKNTAESSPETSYSEYGVITALAKIIAVCSSSFSSIIEYALPTGIFFLRFMEWWYSSDNSPHNATESLPIPPPPERSKVLS